MTDHDFNALADVHSAAGLRAALDACRGDTTEAGLARWIAIAIRLAAKLVDILDHDAAQAVSDELAELTKHDRELAIGVRRALAKACSDIHCSEWASKQLRAALDLARADTTPARWIELAIQLVVKLVDILDDEAAHVVIDELFERTKHDFDLAIGFRLTLARALVDVFEREWACGQLRAALEIAPGSRTLGRGITLGLGV